MPERPFAEDAELQERFGDELEGIDAGSNVPLWDGSRFDYGLAVEGLLPADAASCQHAGDG